MLCGHLQRLSIRLLRQGLIKSKKNFWLYQKTLGIMFQLFLKNKSYKKKFLKLDDQLRKLQTTKFHYSSQNRLEIQKQQDPNSI